MYDGRNGFGYQPIKMAESTPPTDECAEQPNGETSRSFTPSLIKGNEMKELNEEIKLTLDLMKTDIGDGAHDELKNHLYGILEIKRNELQQRLTKRSYTESTGPLTTEELKSGGWWCGDTSEACRLTLESHGFKFFSCSWDNLYEVCFLSCSEADTIDRGSELHVTTTLKFKQIHRVDNQFYWVEV